MANFKEDLGFTSTPRYPHDGYNSIFLGHYDQYDLYFSKSSRETTVIARFGKGGEYASGMSFSFGAIEPLVVARRRAQQRDLLAYPVEQGVAHTNEDAQQDLLDELKEALRTTPVVRSMLLWSKSPAIAQRQLTALAEAKALGYQARFEEIDFSVLQGWVHSHYESIRKHMERFGQPVPNFSDVHEAVYAGTQ